MSDLMSNKTLSLVIGCMDQILESMSTKRSHQQHIRAPLLLLFISSTNMMIPHCHHHGTPTYPPRCDGLPSDGHYLALLHRHNCIHPFPMSSRGLHIIPASNRFLFGSPHHQTCFPHHIMCCDHSACKLMHHHQSDYMYMFFHGH